MDDITLATQTMFAELQQRCLDAEFDEHYTERGNFKRRRRKGKLYWYYVRAEDGRRHEEYVGPASDTAISERINRFATIKSDFRQRQEMVRALTAARLPVPDSITGGVVEAMWKAGFFRLRGVLVGTVAYQCYAGLLGVRLGPATLMTQDADFAQFWGIANSIDDRIPHVLDVLRKVDPSFREIPSLSDPFFTARYQNADGFKAEFLTPNRGSDDHQSKLSRMKALGGAGAQPLRHLDYLIHEPERSVLLFRGGTPVTIPRAERYAIHKLIVAAERREQVKSNKDVTQAATLIGALARHRPIELADAWDTAMESGPRWRSKLLSGHERLPLAAQQTIQEAIEKRDALVAKTSRRTAKSIKRV